MDASNNRDGMPATAGIGCQQQQETQQLDTATSGGSKNTATAGSEAEADSTETSRPATPARTLEMEGMFTTACSWDTCNSNITSNFANQQESKAIFLENKKLLMKT
jgi:hypothetical protein